jgi:MerR-like DNA binding protein
VTLSAATSFDRPLTTATSPALGPLERPITGCGRVAIADAMLMMRPKRRSRMPSTRSRISMRPATMLPCSASIQSCSVHCAKRPGDDVAQRAGLTLEEITPLTGPENRSADASRHIRALADEKLPHIEALITRAQAVKHWLQVAQNCDCTSVDVCGLFVDPTLLPPVGDIDLDIRQIRSRGRR